MPVWGVAAGLGIGIAVGIAARIASRRSFVQRGVIGRNAALAGLGARAGGSYALHRARRVFADAARREELDRAHEMWTAEQVAETLGHMKGAMLKLGQMLSYLEAGLPEPLRDALASLQQDAPPMSPELAAGVVEEELGAAPDVVFDRWDPVPIAAASIGQVHRAVTRDGRAVAVKVQYPGVASAIRADLANVRLLFGGLGQVFPGMEPGPLVEELRARLVEELDYGLEARRQTLFAEHFAGHPFLHVPAVVGELSSARVLTTELAEGVRFDEMETWPQSERDLAAEAIFRFVFGSLYRLGLFNGDPHPGNYLFRPGGQVTFLDFGLVKRIDEVALAPVRDMLVHMVQHPDTVAFRRDVERAGFLAPGAPVTDERVADYFGHFYEYVRRDSRVAMGDEFTAESFRRYFDATGPYADVMRYANVPPDYVIIQRINLGVYSLLSRLHATANWRRISEELWPWVAGPPSTPMGVRERTWLDARGHHRGVGPAGGEAVSTRSAD